MGEVAPVVAGLAVGVAFVLMLSVSFDQSQIFPIDSSEPPGRFREAAIEIALQNSTFQEEFGEREMVVAGYRDWGISHGYYDCPINYCVYIGFADKFDPETPLVSVLINMQSNEVLEIRAAQNLLLTKTGNVEEVKAFLSRYPDANTRVNPGPGYSEVIYEAETTARVLSLVVKTTPIGEPTEMYAECFGGGEIVTVSDNVADFIKTTNCLS